MSLQDGLSKWAAKNDMQLNAARETDRRQNNTQQSRPIKNNANTQPGKELSKEFVDEAERVMRGLGREDFSRPGRMKFDITTSKLRNILSLVSDVYNAENIRSGDKLLPESIASIQMMRVRILYEAGRDERVVKPFVQQSNILEYIKNIGDDRAKFIDFAHYMEALVAYHRYLGGRD